MTKRYKVWGLALFAALLITLTTAGCTGMPQATPSMPVRTSAQAASPTPSRAAKVTTWDSDATQITFSGASASIDGEGARFADGILTIDSEGTYILTGNLTGGVVIDASGNDTVRLVLAGVTIEADKNAAIYCAKADELIVTLADGTENTLRDAKNFTYSDISNEEPDAALFSKVDLSIDGGGALTVEAGFYNGIGTKDDLVIEGGLVTIRADNHGIRGRDSVTITGGEFHIESGSDGIQSNNDEDVDKGHITIKGGSFDIAAGNDAIQAETSLTVSGCSLSLMAGGGHAASVNSSGSFKGLKAGGDLTVSGGTIDIDSADDALHSNANIAVSGGEITIATGDDGAHADGDMTITGGVILITASYEGLEAGTMTISGGQIEIAATDDGINIAGGKDSTGGGRFGKDRFNTGGSNQSLKITDGIIVIDAGSDGIDVNGSAEMTGGDVTVTAATLGEGETIDTDRGFSHTGGNLTEFGGRRR